MQLLFFVAVYLKFTFAQYSYDVYFVFYLHKVLCFTYTKFCVYPCKKAHKTANTLSNCEKIFAKVQNTHRTKTRFAE